eukprot:s11198_g1.t1
METSLGRRRSPGAHPGEPDGGSFAGSVMAFVRRRHPLLAEAVLVTTSLREAGWVGSTPILVLDIPRTTKEGMDAVSTFAKTLSSDSSLAHVIVCASSAVMAIAFDAGGAERQDNFWALLQNRAGGGAVGKRAGGSGALPKDVEKWIRERGAYAVIWHIQDKKYQFASELHAKIAASFKKQIDDLSS